METLSTHFQPFFDWLLRSTFQASIVVCLILLIQGALRSRLTARWHYALWLILVIRMVLPWAPQSRFSIFNLTTQQSKSNVPRHVMPEVDAELPNASGESSATQQSILRQEQNIQKDGIIVAVTSDVPSRPLAADPVTQPAFRLLSVLPFLWLAGTLLLGGYIIICNLKLWRAAGIECPSTDKEILEVLEECRSEIGLRTIVALVPSEKVNTPILLGFIRPRLLVPKSITKKLTREELRYVFLHELAHVKRHDIALGWLTALLQVTHWFNPLIWLAFHRMRSNRELACDALVLSRTQGEGTQDYGRAIVSLLEHFSLPQALPGLAGILESKTQLKRRIAMITHFKKNSYRWSPLAVVLIIILSCISLPDAKRMKVMAASPATPASQTTLRRIWSGPDVDTYGAPSADGRHLSYVDWETGDLAIRELATGKTQRLTKKGSWEPPRAFALNSIISHDNKLVAYSWFNKHGTYDLCLIGVDGTGDRTLCSNKDYAVYPVSWSSDGKQIAARKYAKGGDFEIILVTVEDRSIQVLRTFTGPPFWARFCYSPDDQFVVYDFPVADDTNNHDISLLSIDGNDEIPLIKHPANDRLLGWVPNREEVLFLSDRAGTHDLWVVQVRNGRPQGSPRRIKSGIGQISPMGFTENGSFYFNIRSRFFNTYIATLDLETGKILAPLGQPLTGSNFLPEWSPDGEYMAYISEKGNPVGFDDILHVRSLKTGKDREVSCELNSLCNPRWSPDGHSILVTAYDRNNKQDEYNGGLYKIDVKDGNVTALVQYATGTLGTGEWSRITGECSPDGKAIFYINKDSILKKELGSGRERQLYSNPHLMTSQRGFRLIALSPDGEKVVFGIHNPENGSGNLMLMSASGGKARELLKLEESDKIEAVAWLPNGRYVLFTKKEEEGMSLWRIAAQGGVPQRLWESEKELRGLRIHPDGKRIAFYNITKDSEIWAMENFLQQIPVAGLANQPKFTKIRIPSRPGNGVLSPDGKTLAFISQGSVWVIPVSGEVDPYIAGEPKRLTADIGAWNMNSTLAWSGDGRWITFNAEYKAGGPTKVYVISSAGGDAITVPIPFRRCGWPEEFRLSLSPDGKTLAYASLISADEGESDKPTVFTIPVNGGEAKQLTDAWTQEPAFSPDGDKVAYVKNYRGDNGKRHSDVWLIPAAGGAPVRLSNFDSGQARGPVWSPDGKMIAFHRRPEGKNPKEIWIIPMSENGKPTVSPAKIELPLEAFHAVAGWTPDNKIGVQLMNPSRETIYSVPSTGGIATQITPEGMAAYPKWSPDGSRIFFRWFGGEIASAPAGGGEVTTIPINSEFGIYEAVPGGGNDISPDGKKIAFSGTKYFYEDNKKRWEVDIFTIPTEGGEPTQLTSSGSAQDRFPCWSPDGKSIAFVRPIVKNDKPVFHIHIVSKEGKNLRHITTPSDKVAWAPIDWSPDGKSITYFSSEKTIKSVPIEGGESQVLTSIDVVNSHFELAWSPNGKELAYTCKGKIWAILREGGTPKEIKTGLDPIASATQIGWSPDGKRVAFTLHSGGSHKLHLMENFLPKAVASASN